MLLGKLPLLWVLIIIPSSVSCQSQEQLRIAEHPEAVQRRFLADYLDEGLPLGYRQVNGNTTEPSHEIAIMIRRQSWVIPILEQRAKMRMKDPVSNKDAIYRIAVLIAESGKQEGLDAIWRLFDNQDGSLYIRFLIYDALDRPNYVKLWYYTLDSPNQMVREEAARAIPKMTDFGPNEKSIRRRDDWADAAVDRYKHAPTEEEILSDPIYGLNRSRELKVEEIETLKALGLAEVQRRKNGGKPGHPRH